jgi:hypothetical protein
MGVWAAAPAVHPRAARADVSLVHPLWGRTIKQAQDRTDRLEAEADAAVNDFETRKERVVEATKMAEVAALALMQRHEDLAHAVARHW